MAQSAVGLVAAFGALHAAGWMWLTDRYDAIGAMLILAAADLLLMLLIAAVFRRRPSIVARQARQLRAVSPLREALGLIAWAGPRAWSAAASPSMSGDASRSRTIITTEPSNRAADAGEEDGGRRRPARGALPLASDA